MTNLDGSGVPSGIGLNIYRSALMLLVALIIWLANQTWNGVQAESADINTLSRSLTALQTNQTRDENDLVLDDRRIHNLESDVATIRALQPKR